jgi:hypothetical protein
MLWNALDQANREARPQLSLVCNDRMSKGRQICTRKSLKSDAKIFRSQPVRTMWFGARRV